MRMLFGIFLAEEGGRVEERRKRREGKRQRQREYGEFEFESWV